MGLPAVLLTRALTTHPSVTYRQRMSEVAVSAGLLSDPTRVRILDVLTGGPLRTSELAAATGMSPAALSRHLNLLRRAGAVVRVDVAEDGRGRAYEIRSAALDDLAVWLHTTRWSSELESTSAEPRTRQLLARVGGFLDAFATCDTAFFERHLRHDVVLVFPGVSYLVDKQGCIDSVASHPPYRRHQVLGTPLVRSLGAAVAVITMTVEVATTANDTSRPMVITAVLTEGDPWQLAHLQWTPAKTDEKGIFDD